MWFAIRRLALGAFLIVAASAILLYSDRNRRQSAVKVEAQAKQPVHIAIVQHASQVFIDQGVTGMVDGLAESGFHDGENMELRKFNAEGDIGTANAIAKQVTNGEYRLVLTASTISLQTVGNANRAGKTIHVFALVTDPSIAGVGVDMAHPYAHPKHIAGIGTFQPVERSFALARQFFPALQKVGVVWNPSEANSEVTMKRAREVCTKLGIELLEANAGSSTEVPEAADSVVSRGAQAIWLGADVTAGVAFDSLAAAAKKGGIPVFTVIPSFVPKGSLFDIGADYHEVGRIAGLMAGRILHGLDPRSIPVENVVPEKFMINKTALAGLHDKWTISDEMVQHADLMIDEKGTHEKLKAPIKTPVSSLAAGGTKGTSAPLAKTWNVNLIEYVQVADVEESERGVLDGLRDAGLVESRDFTVKIRNAQGDMPTLPSLVDAAQGDGADLLITLSTPSLQAAIQRVRNIPIIFTFLADPFTAGVGKTDTDHMANVTGVYTSAAYDQMLDLVHRCLPNVRRIGTMFVPSEINMVVHKTKLTEAAAKRDIEVEAVPASTATEVADVAIAMCGHKIDAVCQIGGNLAASAFSSISQAAYQSHMPLFGFMSQQAKDGAALVVARDFYDAGHEAGLLAARVMRGEKPATIPLRACGKTMVIVNMDGARKCGLTIPRDVIQSADKVIGE